MANFKLLILYWQALFLESSYKAFSIFICCPNFFVVCRPSNISYKFIILVKADMGLLNSNGFST